MANVQVDTKILIVESEASDREKYIRFLEETNEGNYQFHEAKTGNEVVQLESVEQFDCVLLNYALSDMDGIDVLLHLLDDDGETEVPVVFLSGQGNEVVAVRAMKNGAAEYLLKNKITPHILSMTVRHVIEKKRLQRIMKEYFTFLETLIETIPNPIYYKDCQGLIKGCNRSFESSIGLPKEDIVGKNVYDFLSPKQARLIEQKDKELLNHSEPGTQFYEMDMLYSDGHIHNIFVNKATYTNLFGEVDGVVEVFVDITEQKKNEERIKHMALHDSLTDLPNRNLFFDRFEQLISRAYRFKQKISLLYLDLDGFKQVNDSFGHGVGDAVLQEVAHRLKKCIRASDSAARIGGDEFAVLLADMDQKESAAIVAENIVAALKEPIFVDTHKCSIGCSIGIVTYPDDGHVPDILMHKADQAMYYVKKNNEKQFVFFREDMLQ